MQKRLDKHGWWPRVRASYDMNEGFTTQMLGGSAGVVRPSANRAQDCTVPLPHARSAYLCMQAYFDNDSYVKDIDSADSGVLHVLAATNSMVRRPALLFRGWPDNRRD